MKKFFKLFEAMHCITIIALIAIIGFSMAACNDSGGGNETPTTPTTPVNYSLDGVWGSPNGTQITVNDSSAVYSKFVPTTGSGYWEDAVNRGLVTVGTRYWQNITSTGNLTWSGQQLGIWTNTSNPNVATGTGWGNCTITMNSNGQTINVIAVYDNGNTNDTWTRVPAYSLDGVWEAPNGTQITVNGSSAVYSKFVPTTGSGYWEDAVNRGLVTVGTKFWQYLTSTGNLTWSGQQLGIFYNTSNPNVATGTGWGNCTITMNSNGQTINVIATYDNGNTNVTWTRVTTPSLDGVWEGSNSGTRVTVNGSTGVFSAVGSYSAGYMSDAISKGYIAVGRQIWWNITPAGNLTWTGQHLMISYDPSNSNVATGTYSDNCTFKLSADGQTLSITGVSSAPYTRR